jgi:glutamate dehydrogenase/leucine dehydrogenase
MAHGRTRTDFRRMLEAFDEAARVLSLDPGIWRILTHPKRQIIVSCPVQMDSGEIEVFTGYRVQYNITSAPPKAESAITPTSPSTRSRRSRPG